MASEMTLCMLVAVLPLRLSDVFSYRAVQVPLQGHCMMLRLACNALQVYDTITDAMYASLSRVEQASGIPQSRQLSKWQHLLAGGWHALSSPQTSEITPWNVR